MMDSHNIFGRIGSLRFNEYNGETVCNVSLAVNRGEDKTTWYGVAVWGEAVERLQKDYVKPGTIMYAEVKNLYAEPYMDKDNKPQAQLRCTAMRFRLVNAVKMEQEPMPEAPSGMDDVPF